MARSQAEGVGHIPLPLAQPWVALRPGICPSSHSRLGSCGVWDASWGMGNVCECMGVGVCVYVCGGGVG